MGRASHVECANKAVVFWRRVRLGGTRSSTCICSSQGGAARRRRRDRACVGACQDDQNGTECGPFRGGVSVSAGGRPLFMRSPAGGLAKLVEISLCFGRMGPREREAGHGKRSRVLFCTTSTSCASTSTMNKQQGRIYYDTRQQKKAPSSWESGLIV